MSQRKESGKPVQQVERKGKDYVYAAEVEYTQRKRAKNIMGSRYKHGKQ
jgi:hypothetical protein